MNLTDLNRGTIRDAAIEYVTRGWPVLPLVPRGKVPLTSHGLLDSTTEPEQILTWLKRWPTMNIGLRTGQAFDVLDVDGPIGRQSLADLAPGYQHTGPVASTGKGWHALFGVTGARNAANKMPGIDFRGENGYIVAAPSVHPNGHRYAWARDGALPEPPAWLYSIVTPARVASDHERMTTNPIVVKFREFFEPGIALEAVGSRFRTNCLWHDDSTPSFYLFPENNSFYCFGCDEWGDTIDLEHSVLAGLTKPSEIRKQRTA